jgi:hypothetical protein
MRLTPDAFAKVFTTSRCPGENRPWAIAWRMS